MKVTSEMINEELKQAAEYIEKMLAPLFKDTSTIENLLSNLNSANKEDFMKNLNIDNKIMNLMVSQNNTEGLQCIEKWIPRKKDESNLRICIYKSVNSKKDAPGILWIHGGGYVMGNPEQSIATYKRLIDESNCVIVAPDYRLSLDEPYPAALDDCYDALLWLKENSKELGVRDDQIMIGGESAGGGLTAALSLYARDKKEVNIAFQMPLYPMIDDRMISESSIENDAPLWNSQRNKWAWKLYLGKLYGQDVPEYAAPSRAINYKNLPPTVTFVGDLEPFKDETIEYVENLKKAGVSVNFKIYNGCYHAFDIICPNATISKEATKFFIESFKYAVNNYFSKQTKI